VISSLCFAMCPTPVDATLWHIFLLQKCATCMQSIMLPKLPELQRVPGRMPSRCCRQSSDPMQC
jgi:hypothetical protein